MKRILIIGGAGFIGINAAEYFLKKKFDVTLFDNFSRKGSRENITWLQRASKKSFTVITGDIRYDEKKLARAINNTDMILHLAGQVAVTTSVENPLEDFHINALGTINVLEQVRMAPHNPILIYSSTNKVYGALSDIPTVERKTRYAFKRLPYGVNEERGVDFYSPYGCSKGSADQYVRDYARIYGLNTIVFRQSCIYGPHQHGIEDQGWVAWFMIALAQNKNITIYGNGKQVRDLLHVDDLLRAYEMAARKISVTRGQIYNIGGGTSNTISIWYEFKPILESLFGRSIEVTKAPWRPGDQPIFVSDIRKATRDFSWKPQVTVPEGLGRLHDWIVKNTKQ